VSSLSPGGNLPGQCPWINTGTAAFNAGTNGIYDPVGMTYPANQNKAAGSTWNFSWGTKAQQVAVEAGISIKDYYPFVVTAPTVTAADGLNTQYPGGGSAEKGGAVFQMTYTPVVANPDTPTFHSIHIIQGLQAFYDDPTITPNTRLDNPAATNTPFYDDGGAAGSIAGGPANSMYFLDRPQKVEDEALEVTFPAPIANVQFQAVIADDDYNSVTNTHNVTLYGGEWWGYQAFASDNNPIPEPASLGLLAVGGMSLLGRRRKAA
jgi:hypothetical protein